MLNKNLFTLIGASAFAFTLAACSGAETTAPVSAPASAEASSSKSYTAKSVSVGSFSGRSDHITTGTVTVEKTASGYQLVFADNFSLDGAPDPVVAYGNNETFTLPNKLGALKHKTGAQTYALPANFKPGEFSEVYVYCEKFSVQLGVAKLSGS